MKILKCDHKVYELKRTCFGDGTNQYKLECIRCNFQSNWKRTPENAKDDWDKKKMLPLFD